MKYGNEEKLLSTGDVAALLSISHSTVVKYVEHGLLIPDVVMKAPREGCSGKQKFKQSTVDEFIRACATSECAGERMLSTGEAAKFTNSSPSTIRRYIYRGLLKPDVVLPCTGRRLGGRRFKISTLEEFAKRCNLPCTDVESSTIRKCGETQPDKDRLLGVVEVADILGVHRDTVHRYVSMGILVPDVSFPEQKDGRRGKVQFRSSNIDLFIKRCTVGFYDGGKLYGPDYVAEKSGLAKRTIRSYIGSGVLKPDVVYPVSRNGGPSVRRFSERTVASFVERRESNDGSSGRKDGRHKRSRKNGRDNADDSSAVC